MVAFFFNICAGSYNQCSLKDLDNCRNGIFKLKLAQAFSRLRQISVMLQYFVTIGSYTTSNVDLRCSWVYSKRSVVQLQARVPRREL